MRRAPTARPRATAARPPACREWAVGALPNCHRAGASLAVTQHPPTDARGVGRGGLGALSWAGGAGAQALGGQSTEFGYSAAAMTDYSMALGAFANAEGNYGSAVGYGSAATGVSSVAVGGLADLIPGWGFLVGTEASGYGASAFGAGAYAPGDSSTAIGLLATASGDSSVALGENSRSEEHTSELQSLMRISSAVFCLKKKTTTRSTVESSECQT